MKLNRTISIIVLVLSAWPLSLSAQTQTPSPTTADIRPVANSNTGPATTPNAPVNGNINSSQTIGAAANQNASPSVNGGQTLANQPNQPTTSVTIGPSGVQLSGFPVWIIWVLLGAVFVGALAFFLWIKPKFYGAPVESSKWIIILLSIALVGSIGIWVGGWMASRGAKQLIDSGALRVSQSGIESSQNSPTQPTDPSTQTTPISQGPQTSTSQGTIDQSLLGPWSVGFIIGLTFLLLAGFEFILFSHVQLRARVMRHNYRHQDPPIVRDIREIAGALYADAPAGSHLEHLATTIRRSFEEYLPNRRNSFEMTEELSHAIRQRRDSDGPSTDSVTHLAENLLDLLKRYNSGF